MPRSRANFFATGEAKIRSPLLSSGFGGFGSETVLGCESILDSTFVAGGGGGVGGPSSLTGDEASDSAKSAAAERSSPSSARMAIIEPTAIFFEPSAA